MVDGGVIGWLVARSDQLAEIRELGSALMLLGSLHAAEVGDGVLGHTFWHKVTFIKPCPAARFWLQIKEAAKERCPRHMHRCKGRTRTICPRI